MPILSTKMPPSGSPYVLGGTHVLLFAEELIAECWFIYCAVTIENRRMTEAFPPETREEYLTSIRELDWNDPHQHFDISLPFC